LDDTGLTLRLPGRNSDLTAGVPQPPASYAALMPVVAGILIATGVSHPPTAKSLSNPVISLALVALVDFNNVDFICRLKLFRPISRLPCCASARTELPPLRFHNVCGSNGGEGTQDRATGDLVVLGGLIHLHRDAPSCIALYCAPLLLSSLSTAASHELGHIQIIWA
jgi:hypothetical protein